jgi:hypothetical protein
MMASVSKRLFAAVITVSAVLDEAVTMPVSFQPAHRAVPVLA